MKTATLIEMIRQNNCVDCPVMKECEGQPDEFCILYRMAADRLEELDRKVEQLEAGRSIVGFKEYEEPERIKVTENLEFDAIYADATRKRIKEGVLFEAAEDGAIIFHNGTDRLATLLASAEAMLMYLSRIPHGLEALVIGMAVQKRTGGTLVRMAEYADRLLDISKSEKQAIFRLGQMDMRQAAVDALMEEADGTYGLISSTLIHAAEAIGKLGESYAAGGVKDDA